MHTCSRATFRQGTSRRRWTDDDMIDETKPTPPAADAEPTDKPLSPAAQRALAEAAERRAKAEAEAHQAAKEVDGPKGPEPTRYGDWERKGIASDF
jgi:hypothetical protein